MHIIFEKVTLHNFLSYGHTEIDLRNRNYCLVKGINNDPLSNSTSNGSGKSSWSSAICWALTGQTIQGLKNNLKNIHIDEKLCYVNLLFSIDDKLFEITRYKEPKSDLKIIINGEDKSGKGIRDSEEILASYIPDLNVDLISSVIILGQSLPGKFTANTPSGRKELLERLSKSDFMITDLKNRLTKVITENQKDLRNKEDSLLENTTKITLLKERLASLNNDLTSKNLLLNRRDECDELKSKITEKETILEEKNNLFNSLDKEKQSYTEKIYNLKSEQINKNSQIKKSYDERLETVKANLQQIKLNYLEAKNKEILNYNTEERKWIITRINCVW